MIKFSFSFTLKILATLLSALAVNIAILFTCPPNDLAGNVAKDLLSIAVATVVGYQLFMKRPTNQ